MKVHHHMNFNQHGRIQSKKKADFSSSLAHRSLHHDNNNVTKFYARHQHIITLPHFPGLGPTMNKI